MFLRILYPGIWSKRPGPGRKTHDLVPVWLRWSSLLASTASDLDQLINPYIAYNDLKNSSTINNVKHSSEQFKMFLELRPLAPKRPMRRLLKKEVSLDTYTWQKKYGHLTSAAMMAQVDERLKRRYEIKMVSLVLSFVRNFVNIYYTNTCSLN